MKPFDLSDCVVTDEVLALADDLPPLDAVERQAHDDFFAARCWPTLAHGGHGYSDVYPTYREVDILGAVAQAPDPERTRVSPRTRRTEVEATK